MPTIVADVDEFDEEDFYSPANQAYVLKSVQELREGKGEAHGLIDLSCIINFLWDNDARVWVATSEDVPGLVLESGSLDALIERVKLAVPELMELNGIKAYSFELSYRIEREDRVVINADYLE